MNFKIETDATDKVIQYAADELLQYLTKYTNTTDTKDSRLKRVFQLVVDDTMEAHCYSINSASTDEVSYVSIHGGSESSVLTGVYELLGGMGIHFDINGEFSRSSFQMDAWNDRQQMFTPFCRNRGIRQHINFPMDISSYTLAEAQEYIKNLARMRMNAITFHSYTGQWHGYETEDKRVLPGNFFYGQRHAVPSYPQIAEVVGNQKDYCIPEAELLYNDNSARAKFAEQWLRELMKTAKQAGLRITFSIEFPAGETLETLVQICRNVLACYPDIDSLEWITPEGGGDGIAMTVGSLQQDLKEWFGEEVSNDLCWKELDEIPEALPGTLSNLKKAIELYGRRTEIFKDRVEVPIQIGLYVTCKHTIKMVKQVMNALIPEDVVYTFLSAHGSLAVYDNLKFVGLSPEELQRTMIYSWIEFDGNMYLQQNSSDGIEQLMQHLKETSGGESIHGVCLNHWRTAENIVTINYAAQAMVAPLPSHVFYKEYCTDLGIEDHDLLVDVLTRMAALDTFNRDNLFNIGFCYLGCWLMNKGLSWIRPWRAEDMKYSIACYERMAEDLITCRDHASTQRAAEWTQLLRNRVICSIEQIKAIQQLSRIAAFAEDDHPERLTEQQREQVLHACESALEYSRKYIETHVRMIADRGCEGTIVSYYATIPTYIDHIKQYFVYGETECSHIPVSMDQPPAPDTAYLK